MTHYPDLTALIRDRKTALANGPIALILIEDAIEVPGTIRHHLSLGFGTTIVLGLPDLVLPADLSDQVIRVDCDVTADAALMKIINKLIPAAPDRWFYYCYNAEYLFYPFSEHRSVGEMLRFVSEERRDVVVSYVVDLYAGDLHQNPEGVAIDDAYFDGSGHYALAREDDTGQPLERQVNVFGGLRWRFEEHIAQDRRRIDRAALFRATAGLHMLPDRSFNLPEHNTVECPWHNSLTAAVASFRTAKALRRNPGSRDTIESFRWQQSERFNWHAQQLLDTGWMEPGQWF
ncbi:MAG: hypothetical protein AAFQ09_04715 [Pseudomonadota bacterium]